MIKHTTEQLVKIAYKLENIQQTLSEVDSPLEKEVEKIIQRLDKITVEIQTNGIYK